MEASEVKSHMHCVKSIERSSDIKTYGEKKALVGINDHICRVKARTNDHRVEDHFVPCVSESLLFNRRVSFQTSHITTEL